jgi:hypothetical protein
VLLLLSLTFFPTAQPPGIPDEPAPRTEAMFLAFGSALEDVEAVVGRLRAVLVERGTQGSAEPPAPEP